MLCAKFLLLTYHFGGATEFVIVFGLNIELDWDPVKPNRSNLKKTHCEAE